ncbi:helicase-related protein [Isoptericola variabilis]|uniref:Helicase domain-containing protein n=1 Tax=Isoptericola variabilis (strain 225) TaxID=743718 RepID=F6FRF0_ISOV2|nr:helicase-related protein [Isoptericola variabilis]AEG43911.1 helicase domain-containing protein [Isoptericola variabilis 225]
MTATTAASPDAAPATFSAAPGSVVIVRDEEWLVTQVEPTTDGHFVHVLGLSELVRDTVATFSTALDTIQVADPTRTKVVADGSPHYRRSRLWLEAMLRKTHVPIAEKSLTVSTQALADPLPYQFAAVRKALDPDNLRPRILLADAVGLGKTLEIGMILSELVRRGRGERILVVTPKHVLEQMQFELWTRFALPFVRLDSTGIQRIRQKLPANRNPFAFFKRVIISIDTLKSDKYVAHLRKHRWDAVVIDESHNVTNSATQNNRLATLLAQKTDALILASATPHNGDPKSFAALIRMLEPSAVKPDGVELDEEQVKRLIIRRHRHSPDVASVVGSDWAERKEPQNRLVKASPIEEEIAQELEDTWLWPTGGRSPYSGKGGATLFPWTLAKAFLSSPAALEESVRKRMRVLDGGASAEDDVEEMMRPTDDADDTSTDGVAEDLAPTGTATASAERAALQRLHDLAKRSLVEPSAKYEALVEHLTTIGVAKGSERRAVVFAERVATLEWLATKLRKDLGLTDQNVVVLHGGLSDVEQQEIVESFKLASSPIRVLVTGDVASEGVNLHSHCHHLVHYDIPWSLIRIEQRNGRIDRYGQRHRPEIVTLLLDPQNTRRFGGDIRVLTKLVEREHHAHKALGDTASLMGQYSVKAEEKAIAEVLREAKSLDDVVADVEDVKADDGPAGLLARLFSTAPTTEPAQAAVEPAETDIEVGAGTGVYDDDLAFLKDALDEALANPGAPPPNGVAWTHHARQGLVTMDLSGRRTADLRQRFEVLPQSYLQSRRVTEKLTLATTVDRGRLELEQAKNSQLEDSTTWPAGHYLAPLHPILDWACDRALAAEGMSRDSVFAVRGGVEHLTVLIQATLTNTRGQVVATSYLTVTFPTGTPSLPLSQAHESAPAAIASLALSTTNTGALDGVENLQPFVAAAVRSAEVQVDDQIAAIKSETAERVQGWLQRTQRWRMQASALMSREVAAGRARITERQSGVDEETALARQMEPSRTLLRPLLVVVPQDFEGEN